MISDDDVSFAELQRGVEALRDLNDLTDHSPDMELDNPEYLRGQLELLVELLRLGESATESLLRLAFPGIGDAAAAQILRMVGS